MDVAIQNRAMTRSLRLLTFAGHPAWLAAAVSIGHRWDVVVPTSGGLGTWWARTHALPPGTRAVRPLQAAVALARGAYDLVICHDTARRIWAGPTETPVACVFHVRVPLAALIGDGRADLIARAGALWATTHRVFVSDAVRESWGDEGDVIAPGVAVPPAVRPEPTEPRVLVAGDFLALLAPINGSPIVESVVEGLPVTVMGLNPGIDDSGPVPGAMAQAMRTHRVFLHASHASLQEGHSRALLDAMAAGMPIVAVAHPDSPIIDGVNGYISDNPAVLRARLEQLLADDTLAARLGAAARATVVERFPLATFQARWRELVGTLTMARRTHVA